MAWQQRSRNGKRNNQEAVSIFRDGEVFAILGGREEKRGGIVGGRLTCNKGLQQDREGDVREGLRSKETHDDIAVAYRVR